MHQFYMHRKQENSIEIVGAIVVWDAAGSPIVAWYLENSKGFAYTNNARERKHILYVGERPVQTQDLAEARHCPL
jgi:hypothetical protein